MTLALPDGTAPCGNRSCDGRAVWALHRERRLALTLTGCGGDQKKANDSPAQLTSQTFSGDWSGHLAVLGVLADFTAQVSVSFDADALSMRVDGAVTSKLVNATGPQNFSMILHAGNQRATVHIPAKLPLPVPFPSCVYKELKQLPPVEIIKSLLKDQMQSRKPDGMDGDFRQWVWDLSPRPGVTGHAWADLDDGNGFRKASESIHVDQNKTKLDAADRKSVV